MNYSRRTLLAAGATGTLALSAGCLETIVGDLTAQRAAPTDAALEDADFAEHDIVEETIEETVEFVIEQEFEATYWISSYTRDIEVDDESREGAAFAAVSTPDVSVLGQSFNPIEGMDNEELIEEFGDELEDQDVRNVQADGSTTLPILDDDRTVDRFVGEREFEGEPIEIEILVSSFAHEDDYLVLIGVYPRIESLREAAEAVYGDELEEELDDEDIDPDDLEDGDLEDEDLEDEEFEDEDLDDDDLDDEELDDEDLDDEELGDEFDDEELEELAEEHDIDLPDDLPEDVEALFESVEHPV